MMLFPNDPLLIAGVASFCIVLRFSSDLIDDFSAASQKSDDDEKKKNYFDENDYDYDDDDNAIDDYDGDGNGGTNSSFLDKARWLFRNIILSSSNHRHQIRAEPIPLTEHSTLQSTSRIHKKTKTTTPTTTKSKPKSKLEPSIPPLSLSIHLLLFAYFSSSTILVGIQYSPKHAEAIYGAAPLGCVSLATLLGIVMNLRDYRRRGDSASFSASRKYTPRRPFFVFLFGDMPRSVAAVTINSARLGRDHLHHWHSQNVESVITPWRKTTTMMILSTTPPPLPTKRNERQN
mmetsp:Transcript_31666/g.66336  ORF Transcript_31666/g.66336 Transcript_31666/m.66336 type:complete len:289 (-) Transcript_31666:868-1734(-)